MRHDMQRVIITRPRKGGSWGGKGRYGGYNRRRFKNGDHLHEPMSRGRGTKQLTDHLGPLYAFLRKRCGSPWDDVWSEICQHADSRSTMGQHLRDHVWDYLMDARRPQRGWDGGYAYHQFLIDEEGTLRHGRLEDDGSFTPGETRWVYGGRRRNTKPEPTEVDAGDGGKYVKRFGVWFYHRPAVTERRRRIWKANCEWCDEGRIGLGGWVECPECDGKNWIDVSHTYPLSCRWITVTLEPEVTRQLSSKQLRRLGLKNDSPEMVALFAKYRKSHGGSMPTRGCASGRDGLGRDGCEVCQGYKRGVPGNENIIDGRVVCDYCTVLLM